MGVTTYKSTDGSAPTLAGTVGSFITLLDAVLVNGYGSKSAAGWTKSYSGSNKAAYRQGSGNQFYMRIQDDGNREDGTASAAGAREAKIRGYEAMSSVDAGTGPFPTTAQRDTNTGALTVRKSTTADSTARDWIILADNRTCYVFVATGDTAGQYRCVKFGEFYSLVTGDSYRTMLMARPIENSGSSGSEAVGTLTTVAAVSAGDYLARAYTGVGSAQTAGKHGDATKGSVTILSGNLTYPNSPDSAIYLSPVWISEGTAGLVRGRCRGLWQPLHVVGSFNDGDIFTGAGGLAGKSFLAIKLVPGVAGTSGVAFMETSDTWESN